MTNLDKWVYCDQAVELTPQVQQQIKYLNPEGDLINIISVTDIAETVPFYLRGIDFTKQMLDLLGKGDKMASLNDGLAVNRLMNKIIKHENNIRG